MRRQKHLIIWLGRTFEEKMKKVRYFSECVTSFCVLNKIIGTELETQNRNKKKNSTLGHTSSTLN